MALRRRSSHRRQARPRGGVDLHAPPAHPRSQEPGRHGRGQGQEGPRLGAGQGGRVGPRRQEGRQEGVQGQEGGQAVRAGTGGHVVADHAHRAAAGPGQDRPRLLERPRRGRRGGPPPAEAREVEGHRQEACRGQEGGTAAWRPGQEGRGEARRGQGLTAQERRPLPPAGPAPEEAVGPAAGGQRAAGLHQFRRRLHRGQHDRGRGGLLHLARRHGRRLVAGRGSAALLHPADRHGDTAAEQGAPGAQEG